MPIRAEDLKYFSKEELNKRESTSVWDKHFNKEEVSKEQFAVALFLEYVEDHRMNLNRGRARALSPFFDLNNDGIVTRNEYRDFIRKFSHTNFEGEGDDKKLLKAALSEASRMIQSRRSGAGAGNNGEGKSLDRGCALR